MRAPCSLAIASLLALLGSAGCTSERTSPECKEVCHKQARCVDLEGEAAAVAGTVTATNAEQDKFDQSECIAACTALQRDREGKKFVAQHVACVTRAHDDCPALLACP